MESKHNERTKEQVAIEIETSQGFVESRGMNDMKATLSFHRTRGSDVQKPRTQPRGRLGTGASLDELGKEGGNVFSPCSILLFGSSSWLDSHMATCMYCALGMNILNLIP
ncbi:hypothetical protein ACMFMF_000836 [Clarireedia jacksonii]